MQSAKIDKSTTDEKPQLIFGEKGGYKHATFWQRWFFFSWTKPFGERCRDEDRPVKFAELGDLTMPEDDWSETAKLFKTNFYKRETAGSKHSLLMAIFDTHWHLMLFSTVSQVFGSCCEMSAPLLMTEAIDYISDTTTEDFGKGLSWVGFKIIILNSLYVLCERFYWHLRDHWKDGRAQKARFCLSEMMFKKMQALQHGQCPSEYTEGKILDLMGENRVEDLCCHKFVHLTWVFTSAAMSMYVLVTYMGWSFLIYMICSSVIMGYLAKLRMMLKDDRKAREKLSDKKNTLLSEIFNSIKMLKLYGWQSLFHARLTKARKEEMDAGMAIERKETMINRTNQIIREMNPTLAYAIFIGLGSTLNPTNLFIAMIYFQRLQDTFGHLTHLISIYSDFTTWEEKIIKFLRLPEVQDNLRESAEHPEYSVQVNGAFTWGFASKDNVSMDECLDLKIKDFKVRKGEFVCLVGRVGCGKSSLINAINGNMVFVPSKYTSDTEKHDKEYFEKLALDMSKEPIAKAPVQICGSASFAEQKAWIESKSIKDVILFGLPFDKERYDRTIKACQLTRDLEILPAGDQTELGEKGINLSGGQKARVSLARAVYRDSDIVLLDDPISALDAETGKKVFQQVIRGVCAGKTTLLATHAVDFFQLADRVAILEKGEIVAFDSFENLKTNPTMAEILAEHNEQRQQTLDAAKQTNSDTTVSEVAAVETPIMKRLNTLLKQGNNKLGDDLDMLPDLAMGPTKGKSYTYGQNDLKSRAIKIEKPVQVTKKEVLIVDTPEIGDEWKDPLEAIKRNESHASQMSNISNADIKKKKEAQDKGKLTTKVDEVEEVKKVDSSTYWMLLEATGGYKVWAVIAFLVFFRIQLQYIKDEFMQNWASMSGDEQQETYMSQVFRMFVCTVVLIGIDMILHEANKSMERNMQDQFFSDMLDRLIRAPVNLFHDITPVARILAYFQDDLNNLDAHSFWTIQRVVDQATYIVFTLYLTVMAVPSLILLIIAISFRQCQIYGSMFPGHVGGQKVLSNMREPITEHVKLTYTGTEVIRAFKKEDGQNSVLDNMNHRLFGMERLQSSHYRRWGTREQSMRATIKMITLAACMQSRGTIPTVTLLLVLSRLEWFNYKVQDLMHHQQESGKKMKKIQKLVNIKNTVQEIEQGEIEVPKEWPQKGKVQFKQVNLRYRPTTDIVLNKLDFEIQPGVKVGVVGRTGAGKSTLGLAILRIMELESGTIEIDGVDVRKVALDTLRQKVTTIPQDPVLFAGTLRFNIDPNESHSNEAIDAMLRKAGLMELLKTEKDIPVRDFEIEEGGKNLSAGEKQLICICRAALRKAKVVIFDEATANIDVLTEQKILSLIKEEFREASVITIAHRLNTIIKSDMVAVMSFGTLKEYAPPAELLKRPDSDFAKLLNELEDS